MWQAGEMSFKVLIQRTSSEAMDVHARDMAVEFPILILAELSKGMGL